MAGIIKRNPLAVFLAVAMHVALVAVLIVGVDWREKPKSGIQQVDVVQATMVDERELNKEINKLKSEEVAKQQRKLDEAKRQREELEKLQKRRAEEKKKLADIEKKRKQKEAAEKKRQETEAQKKAEEQRRLVALKKKQEEEKRKKEEQRIAAEKKRKAEEARKKAEAEKKRKAEIARKKAEAEKKRKAEIARKKAEAAARAKAERQAREAELAAQMQAEQEATETQRVIAQIQDKVQRHWLRPTNMAEGLSCEVKVRLGGGGSVLLANVVKSSGNGAFDRSVEKAVYKADPLPMPSSERLKAKFRSIVFVFKPEQ